MAFTNNHVYSLSTNNVVEIYDKQNPSIKESIITDFFQSSSNIITNFPLYHMSFDANYSSFVMTGFQNLTLRYIIFDILNDSLPTYYYTVDKVTLYTSIPKMTFVANSIIYSFFSPVSSNDSIFCMRMSDNSTFTINLPTSNSSIAVSPDGKIGIVWTKYSQLYIYNITNNFSLVYIYNNSKISSVGKTNGIKFSPDSLLALV